MDMENRIVLQRKDFYGSVSQIFKKFRANSELYDVNLVCPDSNGKNLQAHKLIISAISSVFNDMLTTNVSMQPNKTNCIFLRGTSFEEVSSILDFVYDGEAIVKKDRLDLFLSVAEDLKIQGLSSANSLVSCEKNVKEKETCPTRNLSAIHGIDNLPSTFRPPTSSNLLPINQLHLQLNQNTSPELENAQKNPLNLHGGISPSEFQLQEYGTIDDLYTKIGITHQISPHLLPCQVVESTLIKEELCDTNISNSYVYNAGQSIEVGSVQLTNQSAGIKQTSRKGRKKSIVWEYFNVGEAAPFPAICKLCGSILKCGKVEDPKSLSDLHVSNLWLHLRRQHEATYAQYTSSNTTRCKELKTENQNSL